jgi:hypothetical protein
VLLAAGAVGGGVYYVMDQNFQKEREANEKALNEFREQLEKQETKEKTPTNTTATTSTDPTANWKTYTNSEFGLTFKYPAEWSKKHDSTPIVDQANSGSLSFGGNSKYPELTLTFNPSGIGGCMLGEDDYWYKTVTLNGNKINYTDKELGDKECGSADGTFLASLTVGKGIAKNLNSIWIQYSYQNGSGSEIELKNILDSVTISKPNLYY